MAVGGSSAASKVTAIEIQKVTDLSHRLRIICLHEKSIWPKLN